ncbi:MAG TPA: hypothetical protein VE715_13095, partial [Blastocatellia bacterium]|nr:hypothetical protein [Blastocatellia bacterium]
LPLAVLTRLLNPDLAMPNIALALPAMRFLETLVPETMAAAPLTLDWRVLAFSAGVAIAAGLTFGFTPALAASRLSLQEGLRDGGRGSFGPRKARFQHSLIVIETALAVVLLTIGSLLRQAIWSVDKNQPVARVQTIEEIVARQLSVPSQNTTLLSAFALLALLLASRPRSILAHPRM